MKIYHKCTPQTPPTQPLPKTTPPNIMLTQILQIRRLLNQPIHLRHNPQLLPRIGTKVPTRQLFLYSAQHHDRPRILHLLGLSLVCRRPKSVSRVVGSDAGAVARAREGREVVRGVDFGADDGLAAFRGEVWFVRGFAVAEAPGEEGVVDELE
jgi:hypothetical protein